MRRTIAQNHYIIRHNDELL